MKSLKGPLKPTLSKYLPARTAGGRPQGAAGDQGRGASAGARAPLVVERHGSSREVLLVWVVGVPVVRTQA